MLIFLWKRQLFADALLDFPTDDRFKKAAFQKVATVLSKLTKKITKENFKELKQLPGVGKASLNKVYRFGCMRREEATCF